MDEKQIIDDMMRTLEQNGEISMTDGLKNVFIQAVDDKEGYGYVSNTNKEFESGEEAIQWAIEKMNGIEGIEEWR